MDISIDYLFDQDYYELIYPHFKQRSSIALLDYVRYGWKEGANPSPCFNTAWYIANNPDIMQTGINPLEHYAAGQAKSAWPGERDFVTKLSSQLEDIALYLAVKAGLFNGDFYLKTYPDVASAPSPLEHYRSNGWKECRIPSPFFDMERLNQNVKDLVCNPLASLVCGSEDSAKLALGLVQGRWKAEALKTGLFDPDYYSFTYLEAKQEAFDTFLHYMLYGWKLGYNPSARFNTKWYLKNNDCCGNPLAHCLDAMEAGCKPDTFPFLLEFPDLDDDIRHQACDIIVWELDKLGWFDGEWYKENYSDLEASSIDPQEHYHNNGCIENRIPSPHFHASWYLEEYLGGDARQCAIWHYLTEGRRHGFSARPNDELQILKEENRLLFEQIYSLQDELRGYLKKAK